MASPAVFNAILGSGSTGVGLRVTKAKMSRLPSELVRADLPFQFGCSAPVTNTSRVFRWAFGHSAFFLLKLEQRDPIMESVSPLVLPGDDLALDPEYPPQSFQEWLDDEDRNEVTKDRRTVYVVAPPDYDEDARFAQAWTYPRVGKAQHQLVRPTPQDIVGYLAAFYHGVPVKLLRVPDFRFVPWDGQGSKSSPRFIGLAVSDECVGIRTRACPDKVYARQLNLDDLLDVAISILPEDAYALCLLINHDLYEDADDTFVCGRAYGGSRVAVVSSARYCPSLDPIQSLLLRGEYQKAEDRQRIVILGCCAINGRVIRIVFPPKDRFITAAIVITLAFSNVSHSEP
ncbi:hypothetical protein CNMCM7691_006871 [Aspergillus felis]|uniref:Uncharacterized protein n=1 Tax=Aspergillus felis TaxID=1287682 RepID=A0A8H6V7P7_9EURO|nr:hypothetical protein CNMCM7691_006871 [Aspergillus felis]